MSRVNGRRLKTISKQALLRGAMRASIPSYEEEDGDDGRKQSMAARLRARITLPRVSIQPEGWRKP